MQMQVPEIFVIDGNIQLSAMGFIALHLSCSPMSLIHIST